jgi:large subunit ribosomal protein L24
MSCAIKKGVLVRVITGRSKGSVGSVLSVDSRGERVTVERVNLRRRASKVSGASSRSWVEYEAPIHVSNVAVVHGK